MDCLRYVYRVSCRFDEVAKFTIYQHLDFISMKRRRMRDFSCVLACKIRCLSGMFQFQFQFHFQFIRFNSNNI